MSGPWHPTGRGLFRGINAAASLKQRNRSVQVLPCSRALPRHQCRGLIEALADQFVLSVLVPPLPRHQCRGLIEAICCRAGHGSHTALFRGINAAASLKLGGLYVQPTPRVELFRGINAAASLKRGWHPHYRLRSDRLFRGINAAASLKRSGASVKACATSALPRHQCRGLIEAATAACSGRPVSQSSSAASMPRPH